MEIAARLMIAGRRYRADLGQGISLGLPLDFDGAQVNHFAAPPAHREPWRSGDFPGNTRSGGSCNVDRLRMIPHCNGTHTESVGHICHDRVAIGATAPAGLLTAEVITVDLNRLGATSESYACDGDPDDRVITSQALKRESQFASQALIVRTRPNDQSKMTRVYSEQNPAAYLTTEAVEYVVAKGIQHFLTDLPSIDRGRDGGQLDNHHRFWRIPAQSRDASLSARPGSTITELIYVPDHCRDGLYLLHLGLPNFQTDAAPSRPVLFGLSEEET